MPIARIHRRGVLQLLCLVGQPLLLLAVAGAGRAAVPQPGDVGVFFDAAGTLTRRQGVVPYVPFDLHVVSFDVPGGMEEYEFGVQLPAGVIVSGGRQLPVGAVDTAAGDDNFLVTTGGACLGQSGAFVLVRYAGALFLSAVGLDIPVCLAGATPSRFAGGVPGYAACAPSGGLHPFGAAYAGCALINPGTIPCCPTLRQVTLAVGTAEAATGTPVSLPIHSTPLVNWGCPTKDASSSCLTPVAYHVEVDIAWDPAVATLTNIRWVAAAGVNAVGQLTIGNGAATAVFDNPTDYYLYSPFYQSTPMMLDFVATLQPGQTAVTIDRIVMQVDDGSHREIVTQAGSIVTGSVPDGTTTFGALKAQWGGER